MNASNIVNQLLSSVTQKMHKTRRNAVFSCVQSLLSGASSTVTAIGRGIDSSAKEKHNIKRADRLCSNGNLQSELLDIYGGIARRFITSNRPLIHVDWSDLDTSKRNFLIRAAVALDGRSVTIYQEVHPLSIKEKPATHLAFLTKLKLMFPDECKPIIVTDAGFKTPWFRQVLSLGWDYVGRTRKPSYYVLNGRGNWQCVTNLYKKATQAPKTFNGHLTRYNPLECRFVLYKGARKGRHNINRLGQPHASSKSQQHAKGGKDPWLLSTSLGQTQSLGRRTVAIYRTRMQIEEGFRDMKSSTFGLGYNASKSYKTARLAVLLFLNVIASLVLILLGMAVILTKQHYQYQANSIKSRRVLSYHFVGLRAIADQKLIILNHQLEQAMAKIHSLIEVANYDF